MHGDRNGEKWIKRAHDLQHAAKVGRFEPLSRVKLPERGVQNAVQSPARQC